MKKMNSSLGIKVDVDSGRAYWLFAANCCRNAPALQGCRRWVASEKCVLVVFQDGKNSTCNGFFARWERNNVFADHLWI